MLIKFPHRLKKFILDKYIMSAIVAGIVLWAIAFGIAYVQLFPLEKNMILHIDFQREVDAIGSAGDVAWLIVIFAILFAIDQMLALWLFYRERVLAYLVSYAGGFVMVVGLMVIYYLASIN
jgi:hypothetical protein